MINSTDFANRLKKVMQYHQLTPSSFADIIKVQRSSISHLLSGRNKPSLDFVLKVTKEFEDVELYWLLNGKGDFHGKSTTPSGVKIKSIEKNKNEPIEILQSAQSEKTIDKIVMFYTDGTFKEFSNQK